MYAIYCYPSNAKKVPTNYILLLVFTLCESYIVSFACSGIGYTIPIKGPESANLAG